MKKEIDLVGLNEYLMSKNAIPFEMAIYMMAPVAYRLSEMHAHWKSNLHLEPNVIMVDMADNRAYMETNDNGYYFELDEKDTITSNIPHHAGKGYYESKNGMYRLIDNNDRLIGEYEIWHLDDNKLVLKDADSGYQYTFYYDY